MPRVFSLKTIIALSFPLALLACGIVDTEQAQSVVDLRAKILEIQTTQVDPLISEIDDLESKIEPIEEEIKDLEEIKSNFYDEADQIAKDFEYEMESKYEFLFDKAEEARRAFEDRIKQAYKDLSKQEEDLKETMATEHMALEENFYQKWDDLKNEEESERDELEAKARRLDKEGEISAKERWQLLEDEFDEQNRLLTKMLVEGIPVRKAGVA